MTKTEQESLKSIIVISLDAFFLWEAVGDDVGFEEKKGGECVLRVGMINGPEV